MILFEKKVVGGFLCVTEGQMEEKYIKERRDKGEINCTKHMAVDLVVINCFTGD